MSVLTVSTRKTAKRVPSEIAPKNLAQARAHQNFIITSISDGCDPILAQRLFDLGFRENATIQCLRRAPLGSPIMFRVCDTDICLRASQAKLIHAEQTA